MKDKHSQKTKSRCGHLWAVLKDHGFSKVIIFSCCLMLSSNMNAQEAKMVERVKLITEPKFTVNDFAYPSIPYSSEQHSNFIVSYKVSPEFFVELQGFYDSYLLADVFKMPIRAKLYVFDGFYLFLEWSLNRNGIRCK